jgi:hypothetical protein
LYEKRARDASDFFYPKIATNGAANFEVQIQRKKRLLQSGSNKSTRTMKTALPCVFNVGASLSGIKAQNMVHCIAVANPKGECCMIQKPR